MHFNRFLALLFMFFVCCKNNENVYLNIDNSVSYVGMEKCAACHFEQYNSFIQTGMGKSIRPALRKHSFLPLSTELYDSILNLHYHTYFNNDSLYINEYHIVDGDTLNLFNTKIDYIIGSGHHTNSHLYSNNGYLYQVPLTFYTQDSILDFPPGFENNQNTRFSRKMGLECIACHNAYPDFVLGSENKYNYIPEGIDCERCHGPGEVHMNRIKEGHIIDTSLYIDNSIINPSKLSSELQNDLCARCHLQGNTVLKDNKSFFDFRPGMFLKEVMDVYLPRYSNSNDEFIMASHVDRMQLSKCYTSSNESLSCISCHNPHLSVKKMPNDFFNKKCLDCHLDLDCKEDNSKKVEFNNNCISCHMKNSKTLDIPHVTITDHKIAIFNNEEEVKSKISDSTFLRLECVNNDSPSNESLLQAYLQQYERFEPKEYYLDSALIYLNKIDINSKQGVYLNIYYLFLNEDLNGIIHIIDNLGVDFSLKNLFITKDYSNKDAWTCYRIGESFFRNKQYNFATKFYQQAVKLSPYSLEFRNKYGVSLFNEDKFMFAVDEFEFIINEDNNFISAYNNLGYVYFKKGENAKALSYYNYALKLNPHHEKTLLNKAQLFLIEDKIKDAVICINKILLINPNNKEANNLISYLNEI